MGLLWRGEECVSGTVECIASGQGYVARDAEKSGREHFLGPRKTKEAVNVVRRPRQLLRAPVQIEYAW